MKRRPVLIVSAVAGMIAIAALAQKQPAGNLQVIDWAKKSGEAKPPLALLVEMGLKDVKEIDWSASATVEGAKVVHREGYRFRKGDKLTKSGWEAKSHRPMRAPPKQPAVITLEPLATVGVVFHLQDVKAGAKLTIDPAKPPDGAEKIDVKLDDVLAGKPQTIWDGKAVVRLVSTASPVATGDTEDDFPAACYAPDGTLWVAYIAYTLKKPDRRIESANLKQQPDSFKELDQPGFGDQLFVKSFKAGKWSEPLAITGPKEDLVRCAIAAEGDGKVWVVFSAHRDGQFDLYARSIQPGEDAKVGAEERLTKSAAPSLHPALTTMPNGDLALAYQEWPESHVRMHGCQKGKWTGTIAMPHARGGEIGDNTYSGPAFWHPTIATCAGHFAVVCDGYAGDYDIYCPVHSTSEKTVFNGGHSLIGSSNYEARPSACYDTHGRLWIAYEEGPVRWGKDFGAFETSGNPLYFARAVKVVCLVDGKLMQPVAELPALAQKSESPDTGQKVEAIPRWAYPKIGVDGQGRIWLTYRQKFGSRYSSHPGSYWITFARLLQGDKWSAPIEIAHSDGLLDDRPVLLPHAAGGLRILHNTDGRVTNPETIANDVYMSYVDLPGAPIEPKLVAHEPVAKDPKIVAESRAEQDDVKRIRDYRYEVGGKKLQILRGEFHRHTEVSWDGGPDGSLEDMFRYGIDAAAMDWIGNGDHDNGAGREYSWWLTQKLTDAYHVKGSFTPMFAYERSVSYPHGHRNCVFARRGIMTLPRLAAGEKDEPVAGVHADDTKMFYRYLKELDGVCASHTSATGMGTDWRDNDPEVEPFVEIYQGDRMSYEYPGSPRSGYEKLKPVNIGGWRPAGFLDNALKTKGYKLAFQASSDHFSTHISYCNVLAEKHDRESILAAMKKRRVYASTDNIIVDLRSGTHLMGEEFKTNAAPTLNWKVFGAGPIARIDVIRDSEVVRTFEPNSSEHQGAWTDPSPEAGVHYYYIRVTQADNELAWASPLWIDYAK